MIVEIIKPDGVKASGGVNFSTTQENIYIHGVASGATDVTVDYEGTLFSVSQGDILLDVGTGAFTFPNPNSFTQGIDLAQGINTLSFTSTDGVGTSPATVLTVILPSSSMTEAPNPPQGITANRYSGRVEISFPHTDASVASYNIYASPVSGGGQTGYSRINLYPLDPSTYGVRAESVTALTNYELDATAQDADPLYAEIKLTQSSSAADLLTVSSGTFEIPETAPRIRLSGTLNTVSVSTEIRFSHSRSANEVSSPATIRVGELATTPATSPLYYVVTSVSVVDGLEVESGYSAEVAGKPIEITSTVSSLPVVGKSALTQSMVSQIYLAQPDVAVQAGSAVRDIIIAPFVTEMGRAPFVLDFSYRSSSFSSLIQIDDPLNSGSSISVAQSAYKSALKEALFLVDDSEVQQLIDISFEKLAANFGVFRRQGTAARGEVVFFTSSAPTFTLSVPVNTVVSGAGAQFRTTEAAEIPLDSASSYYDPSTRRYSVTVPVVALTAGSEGNLTSGQITSGAPLGLSVTNTAPTFGGDDLENNLDLAARAIGVLSSVDTGTKAGYERVSRSSVGVIDSFVVGAGDLYMVRDNGLGGKVDVWIRGESLATVTDTVAPTYSDNFDSRFIPIVNSGAYQFKVASASVAIFEMLNIPASGLGLRNTSTGESFDLTGYSINAAGDTIILDANIAQPSYSLTDIILGDWRGPLSQKIVLTRQPVRSITSVQTAAGVAITDYSFNSDDDPLYVGGSSKADDHIYINNSSSIGAILSASGESHVLIGETPDQLNNLGVDATTISVTNLSGTVTYLNPFASSTPDYFIGTGDNGAVTVQRTSGSNISDGEEVLVSYSYRENVVIRYQTNLVVSSVQSDVDASKHLAADVLVKETIPVPVDIKGMVILNSGASRADTDTLIRAALSNLINSLSLGGDIRSSDVIREIDAVEGVSYVKVPLTQLSISEGTLIVREDISSSVAGAFRYIPEASTGAAQVWISEDQLNNKPQDLGGVGGRVFVDEVEQVLLSASARVSPSSWVAGTATITGSQGLSVLNSLGNLVAIADSANRVVLSLPAGDNPALHKIGVNYRVGDNTGGVLELSLSRLQHFTVGDLSFSYEEDR